MSEFATRYKNLNPGQKQAVDQIDGPVMVIAGPGTGKTELLSLRVANILKQTDTAPGNILCLTFTDSGALAIRERLSGLLEADAYKVAVHTFHSFGSEVINRHPEYFYNGARFQPADSLSTYQLLKGIFDGLSHDNVLASKMNGEYTYLKDVTSAISHIKKGGLFPDELAHIADNNLAFADWIKSDIDAVFAPTISKKTVAAVEMLIKKIDSYQEDPLKLKTYRPLHLQIKSELELRLNEVEASGKNTPLSQWKSKRLKKNSAGRYELKDAVDSRKLLALSDIYRQYLSRMEQAGLYDYDDMILRVINQLELNPDLKFSLQEQYQFIMIDEFQDTNDAQMNLVWQLIDSPVNGDRPDVMIVGDDDQAIYRFQGASNSNILDFNQRLPKRRLITLTDNYRSDESILKLSRQVIIQGDDRLERAIDELDKQLTAHHKADQPQLSYDLAHQSANEFKQLAGRITERQKIAPTATRAVIARRHQTLKELLPYLQAADIPVSYELQDDALKSPPVELLLLLGRIVNHLDQGRLSQADQLLPELLAHPVWRIDAKLLWQLSLAARRLRTGDWLSIMLESDRHELSSLASWLVELTKSASTDNMELMLDKLVGNQPVGEFTSPLKDFFFSKRKLDEQPAAYLSYLNNLRVVRQALRDYSVSQPLKLADFIDFVDLHVELNLPITAKYSVGDETAGVKLLSAHQAKGLEFDEVYLVDFIDKRWGETTRSQADKLAFPANLPLKFQTDDSDEKLRLIYVALTRAKDRLILSGPAAEPSGKSCLPVGYLTGLLEATQPNRPGDTQPLTKLAEFDWQSSYLQLDHQSQAQLLKPVLDRYRLNASHLNSFLDVADGGPQQFLLNQLLHFPQAASASAAFGLAIHEALRLAHDHFTASGEVQPHEDITGNFLRELKSFQLPDAEFDRLHGRGLKALSTYLDDKATEFAAEQLAEVDFTSEDIRLGDVRLTGKIDLMRVDKAKKTITVIDYKTGSACSDWKGKSPHDKIKMHHYRYQLLFYKVLIENSSRFAGYTVDKGVIEFVEPTDQGKIERVSLDYADEEVKLIKQLMTAVWQRIQSLDFHLDQDYSDQLKDILSFEATLTK
ncbi:MAG TPA: ATP-dependent DNA helicase [Candidatus Saccharimonadales bacterium]|nr:ATP-dependent DNA helicase [Candidatus Saccharimonadales bacterium]